MIDKKYVQEVAKWMINDGKGHAKKYDCWPHPQAFGILIWLFYVGLLERSVTKILLKQLFERAAVGHSEQDARELKIVFDFVLSVIKQKTENV